jgi:hypothetical protein
MENSRDLGAKSCWNSQEFIMWLYSGPEDRFHAFATYFFKIQFNVILLSTPWSSEQPLSFTFPHRNPAWTSLLNLSCYTPRPSHLHFITLTKMLVVTKSFLMSSFGSAMNKLRLCYLRNAVSDLVSRTRRKRRWNLMNNNFIRIHMDMGVLLSYILLTVQHTFRIKM